MVDCSASDLSLMVPPSSSGVQVDELPTCDASDNSGSATLIAQSPSPGFFFPIGENLVTVTYEDDSGNRGSDTFLVTVSGE